MKLNTKMLLIDLNGVPIRATTKDRCEVCGHVTEQEDLTIGAALVQALTATYRTEQVDGVEKFKRYKLAIAIGDFEEAVLTAEDVVLLKRLIGMFYGPVIVGRVWELLEGI